MSWILLTFNLLKTILCNLKINTIINCAAYTDVDGSENNKEFANKINNLALERIVLICYELNIKLIHISTDYVFDGNKKTPYEENDKTNPIKLWFN